MTDTPPGRHERDDHVAKVIPLRQSARLADGPTSAFERLARRIAGTLTELVADADAEGVQLPPAVRHAALLLTDPQNHTGAAQRQANVREPWQGRGSDSPLLLPADTKMNAPWSTEGALQVLEDWLLSGLMDRRTFLAVSGVALTGIAWEYLGLEPERLVAAIEGDKTGAALITQLEATIPALWALDDTHGGPRVLPYVSAQFQTAAYILRQGGHTTRVTRQLFQIVAKLGQHAGWAAFDAGRHGLAQRYYLTALRAAHQATDRQLAAHILADLAFQAAATDARHDAGDLAEVAMRAAAATPARVRASVATRAAFAHGAAGDSRKFALCRHLAHEQLDGSQPQGGDPDWMYYLTPGHVDALAGPALVHLAQTAQVQGHTRQARSSLRDGLGLLRGSAALRDPQHPQQRRAAVDGAWLALAHALNGDLDQTCHVGRLTVSRLGVVHSARCTSVLTVLRSQLRAAPTNNAEVREFAGELDRALDPAWSRRSRRAHNRGPAG
jgi:hypothetical protein